MKLSTLDTGSGHIIPAMPWYRRMTWWLYPRILVLGMGRFQGFCSFTLSVGNANISIVREVCYLHRYSPSQIMHYCELSVRKDPGGGISLVTPHGGEDGKLEGVHFFI